MKALLVFVVISASVSLVFGQYYMSSPIYAGGMSPWQFGGGGGGFNNFGYGGGFGNFGYGGGLNNFGYQGGYSGLYDSGYYNNQPVILESGGGGGGGFGNLFGDVSGREVLAGATGFAFGSLLQQRRNG